MIRRKKHSGGALLLTLCLVLVFSLLAVPLIYMLQSNTNITYNSITSERAQEIAIGGYNAFERYIVKNEESFLRDIKDSETNTLSYTLDIVSDESGNMSSVNILVYDPVEELNQITAVSIKASATYGEEVGVFENVLHFNIIAGRAPSTPPENEPMFPNYPYYLLSRGTAGDYSTYASNYDEKQRLGLYDRIKEANIYKNPTTETYYSLRDIASTNYYHPGLNLIGNAQHIDWFYHHTNYKKITLSRKSYFYMVPTGTQAQSLVNYVNALVSQQAHIQKEYRNPVNVLHFAGDTSTKIPYFLGTISGNTETFYIDITRLGNGIDETDLIIFVEGKGYLSNSTKDTKVKKFVVKGGNLYFISKDTFDISIEEIQDYQRVNSAYLVHDIGNELEINAPQVTFASGKGTPFHYLKKQYGNMQNMFLFYPRSTYFRGIEALEGNNQYVASGGIVMGQATKSTSGVYNINAFLNNPNNYKDSYSDYDSFQGTTGDRSLFYHSEWRGKPQYFGFKLYE